MSTNTNPTTTTDVTDRQARILEILDATPTGPGQKKAAAATVADEFTVATGHAGNLINGALRAAGRGNEIREGHGGPTGAPKSAADALRAVIEANQKKLDRMTDDGPVDVDDDKAVFASLKDRADRAVVSAQARVDKIAASRGDDRKALIDAERTRLIAAAKDRAESGAATRDDLEKEIAAAEMALTAIES